eukprot:PhM_4_TR10731/c0_g2_i1/m.67339/K15445/TRMT10A, TRM10, RG9MTD2; tRNA (guanine9-N1)-methyltransferase
MSTSPTSSSATPRGTADERWFLKKAAQKRRRREAQIEKKRIIDARWESMTEEERIEKRKELRDVALEREKREADALRRIDDNVARQGLVRVVIDLDFEDVMTPKEAKSTASQCVLSYSICRGHEFRLFPRFIGAPSGGEVERILLAYPGAERWVVRPEPAKITEVFPPERLVYLTADTETVLWDLVPSDVYVIGGFVDRNRHKGLTAKKAADLGLRTARLPLQESFDFSGTNVCKILTINHVVEVLAKVASGESWAAAFDETLPRRRRVASTAAVTQPNKDGEVECTAPTEDDDDEDAAPVGGA